jgi:predicted RecB family nuclease
VADNDAMRSDGDRLLLSPSDLSGFLACPHLTTLELRVARGEFVKPHRHDPHSELIRRKGDEHERRYLAQLLADGRDVTTIDFDDRDWSRAARETEQAIRGGADVVYQACLASGDWRGFADFVERQPDGTYEVVDTKLARHARPAHVLQLCFYTQEVARIQGSPVRRMHVVAGTGERETFAPADFMAYYRQVTRRFFDAVRNGRATYPYPVEHCGICDFLRVCQAQWERDDHLTLVANIRRSQVEALATAEIDTLAALARTAPGTRIRGLRPESFETLRHQAELQLHRRETGRHCVDPLPLEPDRGFALMPEPSPGDVWLDLEGDPYYERSRGLEYLLGFVADGAYHTIWARDRAAEKRAFEELIDLIVERRRRFPAMHVYHYGHYERTALSRLMGEHATREQEMDDLLRGEVLVDLFQVVRQALRISQPSYSIKAVEELYDFRRSADVHGGAESAVLFEEWVESGLGELLDGIRAYNAEDCRSLEELHRWLVRLRPPDLPWREPPERRAVEEETRERLDERGRFEAELLEGAAEGEPRWLLAHLLEYHRREEKPQWWEYFRHLTLDDDELVEDGDTIGRIEPVGEPVPDKKSLVYTLGFPPQEHKIGGPCVDPRTGKSYDVRVDDEQGLITLRRGVKRADEPVPAALIPPEPIPTWTQRDSILRFAKNQADYPALVEILERRPPTRYLFVQGPPGSGKTYRGARLALEWMQRGERVGVTALSHKAIHKFLEEVEDAAAEAGVSFRGKKKCGDEPGTQFESRRGFVENEDDNDAMLDPELQLVAGTSWLFAREELDRTIDTLFVDEAGQFALADTLAVGTAARELVLLGDPNQLPQVTQGSHPPGAGVSVLAHLLGEDETVRPGMGEFLAETWRLRPEVCAFVSEVFYEGRLEPAPVAFGRSLALGNGLRFLPVEHESHRQAAPEEAEAIARELDRLLGSRYVDEHGERPLEPRDVVIVAPYNAHVRCLRQRIPDVRVRIGTVDKFQGQEAPVVFFSMASSSGDEIPRGMEFLFSRNRLTVAISRAKCLAYLVASPRLLEIECRTVDQMRLANALCRLVEVAEAPGVSEG